MNYKKTELKNSLCEYQKIASARSVLTFCLCFTLPEIFYAAVIFLNEMSESLGIHDKKYSELTSSSVSCVISIQTCNRFWCSCYTGWFTKITITNKVMQKKDFNNNYYDKDKSVI